MRLLFRELLTKQRMAVASLPTTTTVTEIVLMIEISMDSKFEVAMEDDGKDLAEEHLHFVGQRISKKKTECKASVLL